MIARFHYDRRQLQDFLESESDSATSELASHVETCPECQSELESIAQSDFDWKEATQLLSGADIPTSKEEDQGLEAHATFLESSERSDSLGRFARFEVLEFLGRGGMGIVMRAHDTALQRHCAVKILAPELASSAAARKRFSREARSAAAVVHPHVVPIQTVDEHRGLPYLVMPIVEGQSLQQRVETDGPLSIAESIRIASQVADGLAAAHAQGLVHRDIKPANILLENGVERVQITDFGLARAVDDASMTRSGVIAGTPQYMSPEQAHGDAIDHRSDLFSLGSVMYFMLTGRSPFRAETTMGVLNRINNDAPRSLRSINADVPEWLEAIVLKMLSKSCEERFQTSKEVSELLESCLAHVQEPTTTPLPASVAELATTPVAKLVKSFGPHTTESLGGFRYPPIGKLVAAAAFAFFLIAGTVFYLEAGKGTIRIETNSDSDVPIVIRQGGKVVEHLTVSKKGTTTRLKAGDYVLEVEGSDTEVEIKGDEVTLRRGETWLATITQTAAHKQSDAGEAETCVVNERAACLAELRQVRLEFSPRHPVTMAVAQKVELLDRLLEALNGFKYPKNGKNAITVWRQSTPRSGSFSTTHNDDRISLFDAIDSFEDRCAPMDKNAIAVFSADQSRVEFIDYVDRRTNPDKTMLKRGQLVILLAPPEVNDGGMEGSPMVGSAQSEPDANTPLKVFEQPKNSTSGYWVGVVNEVLEGRDGRSVSISLKEVDSVKIGELLVVNRPQPEFDQFIQFATVEIKSVDNVSAVGLVVASTRELVDNKYEFMRIQAGDRISRPRFDKKKSSTKIKAATKSNVESVSLATAVDRFNSAHGSDEQPPLTEDEVVARLNWEIQRGAERDTLPDRLTEMLNRIALNRELPAICAFAGGRQFRKIGDDESVEAYQIRLDFGGPSNFFVIRDRFIAPPEMFLNTTSVADPDSTPLEAAVTEFNAMHLAIDGHSQPPLTVKEILGAIVDAGSRRNDFAVDNATFASFQRIAKTHALPAGSKLEVLPRFVSESGDTFKIWSVRIVMPQVTKPDWTSAFVIRKQFVSVDSIGDTAIHWGKPNDDGMQAGFRLIPSQRTYQVGQTIKTEFFYRSISGKPIAAQLPNRFAHQELTAKDAAGKLLEVVEVKNQLPSGAIATQVGQQPIRVKGLMLQLNDVSPAADHNIHESQQPVTYLAVKDGQTISLECKVSDLNDGTLRTGVVTVRIAMTLVGRDETPRPESREQPEPVSAQNSRPQHADVIRELEKQFGLKHEELTQLWKNKREHFQIEISQIVGELQEPRFVPDVGDASHQRVHFKCTVRISDGSKLYWPGTKSRDPQAVYITNDYRVPYEVMPGEEASGGRTDLKFQEVDRITSPDLESVCSVVISPDGKHLYAAARDVGNLLVYQQEDNQSGPHTKLVQKIHSDENLNGALGLRVTPDGKHVVATAFRSRTVCLYARDQKTGKLTEKHVARDGQDGVIGLHWAFDCEVSPDSRFVYVTSSHTDRDASRLPEKGEGNVTVFEIAGEKLRWVQTLTDKNDVFDGAAHISIHPSGERLFVANYRSNVLATLKRDAETGTVRLFQALYENGNDSLEGVYGIACAANGTVYTSSGRFGGEHGVMVFDLARQSDFFSGYAGAQLLMAPTQTIRGGSPELPNFAGGNRVLVSHDGNRVYVMGSLSGTLAAFDRYPNSGELTEATITRVTSEDEGLGPASMTESKDGKYIYAAAQDHSSIIVLQRQAQSNQAATKLDARAPSDANDPTMKDRPDRSAEAKTCDVVISCSRHFNVHYIEQPLKLPGGERTYRPDGKSVKFAAPMLSPFQLKLVISDDQGSEAPVPDLRANVSIAFVAPDVLKQTDLKVNITDEDLNRLKALERVYFAIVRNGEGRREVTRTIGSVGSNRNSFASLRDESRTLLAVISLSNMDDDVRFLKLAGRWTPDRESISLVDPEYKKNGSIADIEFSIDELLWKSLPNQANAQELLDFSAEEFQDPLLTPVVTGVIRADLLGEAPQEEFFVVYRRFSGECVMVAGLVFGSRPAIEMAKDGDQLQLTWAGSDAFPSPLPPDSKWSQPMGYVRVTPGAKPEN